MRCQLGLVAAAFALTPVLALAAVTPREVRLAADDEDARVTGADRGDGLRAIAVGDLDGDGRSDLVLASPEAAGPGNTRFACGEVQVLRGPLLTGARIDLAIDAADLTVYGASTVGNNGDRLGWDALVADLSGDGQDDLVVAAPYAGGRSGRVYLLFGPLAPGTVIDLATSAASVEIRGAPGSNHEIGKHLAAGDLDGDGHTDLAIGSWNADAPGCRFCGRAWVAFGPFLDGTVLELATEPSLAQVWGPGPSDYLSMDLAIGDLSGDGVADLVLGATEADHRAAGRSRCGAVFALFAPLARGAIRDLARDAADLVVYGRDGGGGSNLEGDGIGDALQIGDLDGDGNGDLVIGSVHGDGPDNVRPDTGEAYVLHGPFAPATVLDLAVAGDWAEVWGEGHHEHLGSTLAIGDWNGDCLLDLAIGAHDTTDLLHPLSRGGSVHGWPGPIARGAALDLARGPAVLSVRGANGADTNPPAGDLLGSFLVVADLDGDRIDDLIPSAPWADGPAEAREQAGEVYLVRGLPGEAAGGLPRAHRLLAVRSAGDVALRWDAINDPRVEGVNVWKVTSLEKTRIPVANRAEAQRSTDIDAVCLRVPPALPSCLDAGAVLAAPDLLFYQARPACGENENTEHPL